MRKGRDISPNSAPRKKASLWQVALTMFWGMLMIGKKGTWEREGVTVTLPQVIVGAVITTIIVVSLLVLLTRWAVN